VFAVDFNGLSAPSSVVLVYACGLPTHWSAPVLQASTQTTITIGWHYDGNDGGCQIHDYLVERDEDGSG
jgi:hypothetical protein